MNKPGLLFYAASFAPWIFQVRRTTWIALGVGLLVLFGFLIWGAVALIGGLWGQARNLAGAAPEAVRGTARGVLEQVEVVVPGVREKLGEVVPALKVEPPPRDVSGTDLGPVARYPGLARSHWHRDGRELTVRYEGQADYAAVLNHYVTGFSAQGYAQSILAATPESEKHEYLKGADRVGFALVKKPQGGVKISIVTVLP